MRCEPHPSEFGLVEIVACALEMLELRLTPRVVVMHIFSRSTVVSHSFEKSFDLSEDPTD